MTTHPPGLVTFDILLQRVCDLYRITPEMLRGEDDEGRRRGKVVDARAMLAQVLVAQGWTQADVARELGFTNQAVSNWVRKRKIFDDELVKFVRRPVTELPDGSLG